jgi:cell wall-associated NlpC family hydrolase
MMIRPTLRPLPDCGDYGDRRLARRDFLRLGALTLLLAGCSSTGGKRGVTRFGADNLAPGPQGQEVMIMAMHLIDTGYRFGGKNPEAGVDCSGMVTWLYKQAADYPLKGSARDMAKRGKEITPAAIRPGDLVFFDTQGFRYSHVGIYIGDQRFVHAPNSRGKVRIDRLDQGWFATRFEEARTYLD